MLLDNCAEQQLNRLRWQCRRGQLELDLILNRFLERRYPSLSEAEQKAFARLLQLPDQTLLQWLNLASPTFAADCLREDISDPELKALVTKLR